MRPERFTDLRIGDVVAGGARLPLALDGAARWHALRVEPQREDQAEAWLRLRGVVGFHPVQSRLRMIKGRARVYHRRYIPGLVFALFPGAAVVHRVCACPFIAGAITLSNGDWAVLRPADLVALWDMRRIDAKDGQERRARAARRKAAARVRAGDAALFRAGPFAGQRCEVIELAADGGAVVRLGLFQGAADVRAGVEDLVRARRVG